MKFIAIPDPGHAEVTRESLAGLRSLGVIPAQIGAFASLSHFTESGGVGAPLEGATPKYWRDNATIWQPDRREFLYVFLERNPDGNFVRMPLNFSDLTFEIYSQQAANFYRQYATHFPVIPRLVAKTLPRQEAGRINFAATGAAEDYPLGIYQEDATGADGLRPSFPANVALRFNPQTGQPEAFLIDEYVRAYPFDWTAVAPSSTGAPLRLSDEELVGAVGELLVSRRNIREKAAAIRRMAAR